MDLKDALESYEIHLINRNLADPTISSYKSELNTFITHLKDHNVLILSEVRMIDIERYLAQLIRKGNKPATRARKKSTIEGFFSYCRSRGFINEDPTENLYSIKITDTDQKKRETLTFKEEDRLIKAIKKYSRNKEKNLAIFELFLSCALRVSELCDLKWSDIDEDGGMISIRGKGGKIRRVPLFDEVKRKLKQHKKKSKSKGEFIFTSKNSSQPMTPRAVHDLVKNYIRRANINKNIGCHSLRRTSATKYLREGVNIRYIQLFLGHNDISTTTRYMLPEEKEVNKSLREAQKNIKSGK